MKKEPDEKIFSTDSNNIQSTQEINPPTNLRQQDTPFDNSQS